MLNENKQQVMKQQRQLMMILPEQNQTEQSDL
jgi:hypothetical protein